MDRTSLKPSSSSSNNNNTEDNNDDTATNRQGYTSQAMRLRKKEKSLLAEIDVINPFSLY